MTTVATVPVVFVPGARQEGNSWFFPARTDTEEAEHRVDRIGGQLFCTCRGFITWKHCNHADKVRKALNDTEMTREVATVQHVPSTSIVRQNPAALAVRLSDMKENRGLTQRFFKEVMEEGVDFGVIPGTDKPTLFKAGAESLCELYGYAPTYSVSETNDLQTGFLRVVVTCTLVQRGSGDVVAQGIGECNTREARYFYRWMSENQLKKLPELWEVRDSFKKEERSGRGKDGRGWKAMYYRIENDDLFTLWNTVTKMAKKRAHVDATLSATRSSGLFAQGKAALDDWIDAEFEEVAESNQEGGDATPEQDVAASPVDLLNAIGQAHGNKTMLLAKEVAAHLYGTTDLGKLNAEQGADYATKLRVWLTDPNHEHAPDERDGGLVVCKLCGLKADAAPTPAQVTDIDPDHEHVSTFDEKRALKVCSICGVPLQGPDAPPQNQPGLGV